MIRPRCPRCYGAPRRRLVDPGFPYEPSVMDVADWATGVPEKHRAAPKTFAIGLDAGGDRSSGLGAFHHHHTHVSLRCIWFLKQEPGRLDCACCRCSDLGASRTRASDRARGSMLAAVQPTG